MMIYRAEKRKVRSTGIVGLGWAPGRGYITEKTTIRREVWCVVGDEAVKAECRSKQIAESIAKALNSAQAIKPHADHDPV